MKARKNQIKKLWLSPEDAQALIGGSWAQPMGFQMFIFWKYNFFWQDQIGEIGEAVEFLLESHLLSIFN